MIPRAEWEPVVLSATYKCGSTDGPEGLPEGFTQSLGTILGWSSPHQVSTTDDAQFVLFRFLEDTRWAIWSTDHARRSVHPSRSGEGWKETVAALDAYMITKGLTMPTVSSKKATVSGPWDLVRFALEWRSPRTLLYGPPGTGKTKTPYLHAMEHGWQCLSTTLTEDTPMTELRGHFVLKGNEFVWHDGLIARAWRLSLDTPVLVILNEIDHASGDTSTFLHNALDDPEMASMDMPNDETLRPFPEHVMYVATMNGVPEDLSFALRDRFPVKINLETPNPEAITSLPPRLRTMGANLGSHPGLTLRGLYEFARLSAISSNDQVSARLIFGDASPDFLNALKLAE